MIGIWLQWDFNGISCEAGFKCSTWMKILRFYHLYKRLSDGHPAKFLWNLIWQWKNHGHQRVEWQVCAMCKINSPVQSPDRHHYHRFLCFFAANHPKAKMRIERMKPPPEVCHDLSILLPSVSAFNSAKLCSAWCRSWIPGIPRVTSIWDRSEVAIIWMLQSWNMIIEPAKKQKSTVSLF